MSHVTSYVMIFAVEVRCRSLTTVNVGSALDAAVSQRAINFEDKNYLIASPIQQLVMRGLKFRHSAR